MDVTNCAGMRVFTQFLLYWDLKWWFLVQQTNSLLELPSYLDCIVWSGKGSEKCAKLCRQIRSQSSSSNPQCNQSIRQFERNTL